MSVKASTNLWAALVRPNLEYASETWGADRWPKGEKILHDMGRRILRCHSKTALAAIRGELGWCPLRSRRDVRKLSYWLHILTLPDTSLVKQVFSATL